MLLKRLFQRVRTRSSGDTNKRENHFHLLFKRTVFFFYFYLLSVNLHFDLSFCLETCLCTTAKRDSYYEDLPKPVHRPTDSQSTTDHYGFFRSGNISFCYHGQYFLIDYISINRSVDNRKCMFV